MRELGLITWDFSKLTMNFTMVGNNITLQGLVEGTVYIASHKQASKMNNSFKRGCTLLMTHVTNPVDPFQLVSEEMA